MEELNYKVWFYGNPHCIENLNVAGVTIEHKILNSFLRYGNDFFEKLEYEFIIVIQNLVVNKTTIARDRFGIEPLYIKRDTSGAIQFSQSLKDLTPDSSAVNYQKISKYLFNNTAKYSTYSTDTFYHGITTVLPGHIHEYQQDKVTTTPFWRPEIPQYEEIKRNDYISEFRELLVNSLKKTTDKYSKVGSHLSGGLDSSSLTILYNQIRRPVTFYQNTDISANRDKYYADLIAERYNTEHYILSPGTDVYSTLHNLSLNWGSPEHLILPSSFNFPISKKAQELGCDAIISGHDGDTVAGHGYSYLDELEQRHQWGTINNALFTIASGIEDDGLKNLNYSQKRKRYIENYISKKIFAQLKSGELKKLKTLVVNIKKELGYIPYFFGKFMAEKLYTRVIYRVPSNDIFIDKSFDKHKSAAYIFDMESLHSLNKYTALEQFQAATSHSFVNLNEELFAIGKMHGHRYVFPFLERRLLELSMSVPDRVKFGNGRTRALLRESLKNDIPKELYDRIGKSEFSQYALLSCQELWANNIEKFSSNRLLWDMVNLSGFLRNINYINNPKIPLLFKRTTIHKLNKAMYLGIWLDTLNS